VVQPAAGVPVYPVVFIDAIFVKVRDGQVTNRPIYVAIGVTCAGERDILGLWAGDGGEGAKFWLAVRRGDPPGHLRHERGGITKPGSTDGPGRVALGRVILIVGAVGIQ